MGSNNGVIRRSTAGPDQDFAPVAPIAFAQGETRSLQAVDDAGHRSMGGIGPHYGLRSANSAEAAAALNAANLTIVMLVVWRLPLH